MLFTQYIQKRFQDFMSSGAGVFCASIDLTAVKLIFVISIYFHGN